MDWPGLTSSCSENCLCSSPLTDITLITPDRPDWRNGSAACIITKAGEGKCLNNERRQRAAGRSYLHTNINITSPEGDQKREKF